MIGKYQRSRKRGPYNKDIVPGGLVDKLVKYEKALIARALARTGGNSKKAADLLGIGRSALVERRRRLGFPIAKPNVSK